MTRRPIKWNREALDDLLEIATGVLILVILPLSTIPIAALIGEWGAR